MDLRPQSTTGIGERRASERGPHAADVSLRLESQILEGNADNLSQAGVLFFCDRVLHVTAQIQGEHEREAYAAQIVRIESIDGVESSYAVAFDGRCDWDERASAPAPRESSSPAVPYDPEVSGERRRAQRRSFQGRVRVEIFEQALRGPCDNISELGMLFTSDEQFRVRVLLEGDDGAWTESGQLARLKRLSESRAGYAIEFDEL